jgi:hypothetical protein
MYYLLDKDKKPYKVSLEDSLILYKKPELKVTAVDLVDGVRVSTVFLGMDHGFRWEAKDSPNYKPILWETMIFGGKYNDYQERYTSHEDALKGHQKAINLITNKTTENGN